MPNQITLEEALELVDFELCPEGWRVKNVEGDVCGDVCGNILGDVCGDVCGDVMGSVRGDVRGDVAGCVGGTISGRQWNLIETPKDKLKRLVKAGAGKDELLAAINQLEESSHD